MIKRVIYTFLILFGILITVGFFRYNPTVIYANKVPASAETIVHVNLREIEYNILFSFLKAPLSQFDFKKSSVKKEKKKTSLLDQVEIPNSVFFYTNKQEFDGFLISSPIPVKDKFTEALKEEGFKEHIVDEVITYTKKRVVCIVRDNSSQVLFKLVQNAAISPELLSSLNQKEYLSEDAVAFKRVKNSESPIVVTTSEGDFLEAIINDGCLTLQGKLSKENDFFKPYQASFGDSSIANISGRLNTQMFADNINEQAKQEFKKFTTLSLDSITDRWNGVVDFNLTSFVEKSDTIVTYEYDDDFNKVEKKEIQYTITPNVALGMEGKGLCNYLSKKQVITLVENDSVLTLVPLFTTYAFCEGNQLKFSSVNKSLFKRTSQEEEKFILYFDVEKYQEKDRGIYILKSPYLDRVKMIEFSVTDNNEVKGEIQLQNTSKNFFLQF